MTQDLPVILVGPTKKSWKYSALCHSTWPKLVSKKKMERQTSLKAMGQFLSTRQKEFPFGPYANKSRSFSLIFFGPCVKCPKAHPFGPYAKLYLFLFSGKTSTSWSKAQPFDSTIDVRRENVMTFDDSGWEIFQKGIFIQFVCYGPKKLKWPNNHRPLIGRVLRSKEWKRVNHEKKCRKLPSELEYVTGQRSIILSIRYQNCWLIEGWWPPLCAWDRWTTFIP